jgi:type II secretory pathway component PulC
MMTVAMTRCLPIVLLLTACSGARADRHADEATPESTEPSTEPSQPESAKTSGAVAYAPTAVRVPDGAIDRVLLERVLAAGPGWLLSEVPLQPTFLAKHKFNGFKIVSLFRNEPKVLRYGVLPGDIVRAVNGQKIVTPGDLLLVFARLKTADAVEIDVQRDGVDRAFRFPILPALGLAAIAPAPADSTGVMAR